MRFTVVDGDGTVSFVAPWNTLKALVAGCSQKPAPENLISLIEAASKYDGRLKDYVLQGLEVFDQSRQITEQEGQTELSPQLEQELRSLLSGDAAPDREISYDELDQQQRRAVGKDLAHLPVLRVVDEVTRQQSLEPLMIGLVIFNLPAKRIIQVQNTLGVLQRSDRGRYFENGEPTERLYFYRLPSDWTMVP